MPWYIPLIAALTGSALGFLASFLVTKIQFERQSMHERRLLLLSLDIEISTLIKMFQTIIDAAAPQTRVQLPSKKEIENICSIYRSNCGKIGILPENVAAEVVKFYGSIFAMRATETVGSIDFYQSAELQNHILSGNKLCNYIRPMR